MGSKPLLISYWLMIILPVLPFPSAKGWIRAKWIWTDCSLLKNLLYCHGFHVCFPDPVCHKFRNVLGIWGIVYGFGQISNINGGISILALHMPNIAICLFDPFFINDCPGKIFGKGLTDQGILHILKNFLFFCFNP